MELGEKKTWSQYGGAQYDEYYYTDDTYGYLRVDSSVTLNYPPIDPNNPCHINSISITIQEPSVGSEMDYEPVIPASARYHNEAYNSTIYKNGVCWRDETLDQYLDVLSVPFTAGHVYSVII